MRKFASLLFFAFLLGLFQMIGTEDASAIPAWARKYEVSCSRCHYPAYPRLNSEGQRFRRAGYRFDDEFGQPKEYLKVEDYAALRGRFRYQGTDPEVGKETSEFQFHDATFFYAGPVSANFSAFFELETEPESGPNETGVVAQVTALWGNPDDFWTARIGQFHTFTRVGFGGFDRPTGISVPSVFNNTLTTINPFKLKEDQRGIEIAYTHKDIRFIGQILNGVDSSGDGNEGKGPSDVDQEKDVAFAFEWIFDDRASGLTALVYHGRIEDPGLVNLASAGLTFNRYALSANKVFNHGIDVMGGFVLSSDTPTGLPGGQAQIDGEAYFFTLEKLFESTQQTIFARYDSVDVDTDISDNTESRFTLGWVMPIQENIRLAAEYTNIQRDRGLNGSLPNPPGQIDTSDDQFVAELMIVF